MEIDQETAKQLLVKGATVVLLKVPVGSEFGIDLKSWTTGEKFKGVKMIPPGIHMLYYNARNKHGDMAPRVSFLREFKESEFFIRHWDSEKEEISQEEFPEEEAEHIRTNLQNLDTFLGAYPYEIWKDWTKLSSYFDVDLIRRLSPETGVIRSALELVVIPSLEPKIKKRRSTTSSEKEQQLLPDLIPTPGTDLRLTPIPDHSFPEGSTPAEITKHSMDSSYMLETMFLSLKPQEVLGEIQFSFVAFLIGLSMEALEHWTKLVSLVCRSESAIHRRREFFSNFLPLLEAQLSHVPEDFLVDIVASENVIYRSLRELFRNMEEGHSLEGRLRCEAARFKERLTEKFSWDFDDLDREEDDEAPVVVDL